MNTNLKPNRPGPALSPSVTSFRGNVSRRVGNIRAVTLDGKLMNADQILGADAAVQESIEETFGEERHNLQLEADRKSYELKDDVLTYFGKVKDTPR